MLDIHRASVFGCSSGGCETLALCALYPSRIKCGIVHEVPYAAPQLLMDLKSQSDEEIVAACQGTMGTKFIEQDANDGPQKWKALGAEYHARLAKNYVTWVKGYVNSVDYGAQELADDPENLRRRPIFWTVGGLNPGADKGEGVWQSNFEIAKAAGLKVDAKRLMCLHLPDVTVPEETSDWILECIGKVKD